MMTGDIPMSGQFDIFFQAERSLHDALAVLYQTVQVAGGTQAVRSERSDQMFETP